MPTKKGMNLPTPINPPTPKSLPLKGKPLEMLTTNPPRPKSLPPMGKVARRKAP